MAWTRQEMAARAARELQDGFYVNLGIGIPTLVANYIPAGMKVTPLSGHGFNGRFDGNSVGLAGGDVFYGSVA